MASVHKVEHFLLQNYYAVIVVFVVFVVVVIVDVVVVVVAAVAAAVVGGGGGGGGGVVVILRETRCIGPPIKQQTSACMLFPFSPQELSFGLMTIIHRCFFLFSTFFRRS